MSCDACAIAESEPTTGRYTADCTSCAARMLANGPRFWEACQAETILPAYRSALQKIFGANWMAGHQRVKHYAERIKEKR